MSTKSVSASLAAEVNATPGYHALEPRIAFDAALAATVEQLADQHPCATDVASGEHIAPLTYAETQSLAAATAESAGANPAGGAVIVFIDSAVTDPAVIAAAAPHGAEIIMLDGQSDGLHQIATALAGRSNVDAVHIVSHGAAGELRLGNVVVDNAGLAAHAEDLATIKSALADQADILVYGCDVAAGDSGQAFVTALAEATGADIAASTDDTGAATRGGDWDLETRSGLIEASLMNAPEWTGLLAPLNIVVSAASGPFESDGVTAVSLSTNHPAGSYVIFKNAGTVGSTAIDLRATIVAADPGVHVSFNLNGDNPGVAILTGVQLVAGGPVLGSAAGTATIRWSVYQAGTNILASGEPRFTVSDIDGINGTPTGVPSSIETVAPSMSGLLSFDRSTVTTIQVSGVNGVLVATGTQEDTVAGQSLRSNAAIRFNWGTVSSWDISYTAHRAADGRLFAHDGDGDFTFSPAVQTTYIPLLDLDGNDSSATGTAYAGSVMNNGTVVPVVDSDSFVSNAPNNLSGGSVVLTNPQSGDTLSIIGQPGASSGTIPGTSITFSISGSTVTFSGTGSAAHYQTALESVGFAVSAGTTNLLTRTFASTVSVPVDSGSLPGLSATSTIAVNAPPVDGNETAAVTEDTTRSVPAATGLLANAVAPNGDTPTVAGYTITGYTIAGVSGTQAVGAPVGITGVGSITINADGSYTFDPAANYTGSIPVITYTVTDRNGGTDTSTLSLSMTPVNDPPVDGNETNAVTEDTTLTVPAVSGLLVNATDIDGGAPSITGYTIAGVSGTQAVGSPVVISGVGSITLNADGSYTFAPAADYAGSIPVITYTVSDGAGGTDTSTLVLSLIPVNDAPVAVDDSKTVTEDMPATGNVLSGLGTDMDLDGDTLTVTGFDVPGLGSFAPGAPAAIPGVGTLTINTDGSFTFTPAANYDGVVPAVAYAISDGHGGTDTAVLQLVMQPVDDPIVNSLPVDWTTLEDTAIPLTGLSVADPDYTGVVTVILDVPAVDGSLSATGTSSVTVAGSGSNQITLTGTLADINAFLAATPPSFAPALNFNGDVPLTMTSSELGAAKPLDLPSINGTPSEGVAPSGWTIANQTPDIIAGNGPWPGGYGYVTSDVSGVSPQGGEMGLFLNNANGPGEAWQTALTGLTPGQTYVVSLVWQQAALGGGGANYSGGQLAVSVDGVQTVFTGSGTPSTDGWQTAIVTFTATGSTATFSAGVLSSATNGAIVIDSGIFLSPAVDIDTRVIHVTPVNDPPVAIDDAKSVSEDGPSASGNVISEAPGQDTDIDGGSLSVTAAGQGATALVIGQPFTTAGGGVLTLNADGSYTFVPGTAYNGLDVGDTPTETISYTVNDGNGGTATALLVITINGANDAPVVVDPFNPGTPTNPIPAGDPLNIIPDATRTDGQPLTPIQVGQYVVDPDGESLTFGLGPNVPSWVGIDPVTGVITGTPPADASQLTNTGNPGEYLVTITATDPDGTVATTTVTLTILNLPPVAGDDAATVSEDGPAVVGGSVFGNDGDTAPDSDPIRVGGVITGTGTPVDGVGLVTPVAGDNGGTFTVQPDGSYTFDPGQAFQDLARGETRATTVTYVIYDDNGGSDTATLTVTVTGANDTPTLIDPTTGLPPVDPITGQPIDPAMATLLPPVSGVDGAPIAPVAVGSYFGDVDTSQGAPTLSVDPTALPSGITFDPATGTFSGAPTAAASNGGNVQGQPGVYRVPVTATDPLGASVTTIITFTLTNPAPIAQADDVTTSENAPLTGSVFVDNGHGPDVGGPLGDTDPIRVCGVITGTPSPIDGVGVGTPVTGSSGGTFVVEADGSYVFDPGTAFDDLAPGETRTTAVTYRIYDDNGGSSVATLTVTVTGTNDAPEVIDPATGLPVDPATSTLAPVTGDDGSPITAVVVGPYFRDLDTSQGPPALSVDPSALPPGITFDPATGTFSGTPTADASQGGNVPGQPGVYRVPVTATDPFGASVTTTITFTIGNPPPVATDDAGSVSEDGPTLTGTVRSNDHDSGSDGDQLTVVSALQGGTPVSIAQPFTTVGGGFLTLQADGSYTFDPGTAYNGLKLGETATEVITYTISDGNGGTATATLTITIDGANDGPVVIDPANPGTPDNPTPAVDPLHVLMPVTTTDGASPTPIDIGAIIRDPDGEPLVFTATGLPPGLSIDPATGVISGTLPEDASKTGPYTVVVTATDPHGATTVTEVVYNVLNVQPVAVDDTGVSDRGQPTTVAVLANDHDGGTDHDPLTVILADVDQGTVVINPDGALTYTPVWGYEGPAVIRYRISDGNGGFADAVVRIAVTADPTARLPDAPAPEAPRLAAAPERLTVSGMVLDTVRNLTRDFDTGATRPATAYDVAGLSNFSLKFSNASGDPVVAIETFVRKNVLIVHLGTKGFLGRDTAIEWKVQRVDGRPMPDWLQFTGRSVLMGERAVNEEVMDLRITAILPDGTTVSRDVRINAPTGEMQPLRLGKQGAIAPFWEQIRSEPLLRQAQIEDLGRMLQAAE